MAFVVTACSPVTEPPAVDPPPPIRSYEDLPREFQPHPHFDLTLGELYEMIAPEPVEVQQPIRSAPGAFLEAVAAVLGQEDDLMILVDKRTLLTADYEPEDLVSLEQYRSQLVLNRENMQLRAILMPDLLAMVEAARQDGITLDISSAYRSYSYQTWLFDFWVERLGQEQAERSSARPGASQHQLGTAIDFGSITGPFAEHPAGRWLAREAHHFGFSLSYPGNLEEITGYIFEPWHFRYIGRPGTALEQRFFGGIQQFMMEFWYYHGDTLRARYTRR